LMETLYNRANVTVDYLYNIANATTFINGPCDQYYYNEYKF
jgi:hypothetical protein